jgi:hypothetical protein
VKEMGKDSDQTAQPQQQQQQQQQNVSDEVQDTKVRTPGEEPGQVETRSAEEPVGGQDATPVYPEPTGTDNGLPTTLKPSAAG